MAQEKQPLVLDIHIPYCITPRRYGSFRQAVGSNAEKNAYMAALKREVLSYESDLEAYEIRAVRLSGGNATVMSPDLLGDLLKSIRKTLPLAKGAQISVDSNPLTIGTPALTGIAAGQPNRMELMLHSTDDGELEALNLPFRMQNVRNAVLFFHKFHINNVGFTIDLGFPAQTDITWHNTLHAAVIMRPAHIHIHLLHPGSETSEGGEEGQSQSPKGPEPRDGDDRSVFARYVHACSYLKENGYIQYSASDFCLPHHGDLFTLTWMEGGAYIGTGVGAATLLEGFATRNTGNLKLYIQNAGDYEKTTAKIQQADSAYLQAEYVSRRLKSTEGLRLSDFGERYGCELPDKLAAVLSKRCADGLLEETNGQFIPTQAGLFEQL